MKTISINDLSESVRDFLDQASDSEGLSIKDETGRLRLGEVLYPSSKVQDRATLTEKASREQVWIEIQAIQEKVGERMQAAGITEDDIDRVLAEDE
ncbi:MAG: hypothetical protein NVSMB14_10720 [Isosphaeraceae bacterium]